MVQVIPLTSINNQPTTFSTLFSIRTQYRIVTDTSQVVKKWYLASIDVFETS